MHITCLWSLDPLMAVPVPAVSRVDSECHGEEAEEEESRHYEQ
jgi:hypothetical protein